MSGTNFLQTLINFPKDSINDETVELLDPYLSQEDYTLDVAKRVCGNVAGLLSWTRSMAVFFEINKEVLPLKVIYLWMPTCWLFDTIIFFFLIARQIDGFVTFIIKFDFLGQLGSSGSQTAGCHGRPAEGPGPAGWERGWVSQSERNVWPGHERETSRSLYYAYLYLCHFKASVVICMYGLVQWH